MPEGSAGAAGSAAGPGAARSSGWSAALVDEVRDWIAHDPDPDTRAELDDLLEQAVGGDPVARGSLVERFQGPLPFGTAGIRGAMGSGPSRMNLAVVVRTAAGIARWLEGIAGPLGVVVIGFDGRHHSREWAAAMAEVLAAAGRPARLLPGPLPTPVLAFAVRHLGAVAGLMVTASHNPAEDNGCKVYDGSGRQIVAPTDGEIGAAIESVGPAAVVPRAGEHDPDIAVVDVSLVDAYVAGAVALGRVPGARDVRIVHSALHGVSAATFRRVMEAAGFPPMIEIAEQAEPDPDFPTVDSPNPEGRATLDLAIAAAAEAEADVVLVHDPDGDRLRVVVPDTGLGPRSEPGGWRPLSGDEVGVLLAAHLLAHGGFALDEVVATTVVSSNLLSVVAEAAGVDCVRTLTGFKWLTRAGDDTGRRVGYAYEEALGYCVGSLVGDKDGLSAGLLVAESVAALAAEGRSVLDVLDDLAVAHDLHLDDQVTITFDDVGGLARRSETMTALRARPPARLADQPVRTTHDFARSASPVESTPNRRPTVSPTESTSIRRPTVSPTESTSIRRPTVTPTESTSNRRVTLPPADLVVLELDGGRVAVRPSGTEPKLKAYLEVVEPVGSAAELAAARARAAARLAGLRAGVTSLLDGSTPSDHLAG